MRSEVDIKQAIADLTESLPRCIAAGDGSDQICRHTIDALKWVMGEERSVAAVALAILRQICKQNKQARTS